MAKANRNRTSSKPKAGSKPAAKTVSKPKPLKTAAKPVPVKTASARPPAKPAAKAVKAVNGAPSKAPKSTAPAPRSTIRVPVTAEPPAKSASLRTVKPMTKKARAELSTIVLPTGYRPSDDEPFMNPRQRVYFRNKLQTWKDDIIKQNRETLQVLHEDTLQHADLADRATSETERALELRARDRQRKLIAKIDAALARIEDGSYGYCEETGEPISLKRLDARPIATLSLEAQERHERRERVYRED
jgi:DnaK suppressor protein